MSNSSEPNFPLLEAIMPHYGQGREEERITAGGGSIELIRTQELLRRFLPPPPALILDVGGGAGVHALWLARQGYQVHLTDLVPLHVEQALAASARQAEAPLASATVGDARYLTQPDNSADAVLSLGPLYHLTERADRLTALKEAHRVLKPTGKLFAVAISRFASALDGMTQGFLDDPEFVKIVQQDLADGQHRNPTNHPAYFTTAYFQHPNELKAEVEEAGFNCQALLGIEGPAWLSAYVEKNWQNESKREQILAILRQIEQEPTLLGVSAHLMAVGEKPA